MQPTAYTHRLSTESGPLGGERTHNPEVRNLGPYHYASGETKIKTRLGGGVPHSGMLSILLGKKINDNKDNRSYVHTYINT